MVALRVSGDRSIRPTDPYPAGTPSFGTTRRVLLPLAVLGPRQCAREGARRKWCVRPWRPQSRPRTAGAARATLDRRRCPSEDAIKHTVTRLEPNASSRRGQPAGRRSSDCDRQRRRGQRICGVPRCHQLLAHANNLPRSLEFAVLQSNAGVNLAYKSHAYCDSVAGGGHCGDSKFCC